MGERPRKPTDAEVMQIAARRPDLLNALVAFFCMGWQSVDASLPPHGRDQMGHLRLVPDYVRRYGVQTCEAMVIEAPEPDNDADPLGIWIFDEIQKSDIGR